MADYDIGEMFLNFMLEEICSRLAGVDMTHYMLIPQVRPAHKYPNSPWEMIHPPGGDNAVCM
jgi:hypothetical protein